MRIICGSEDVVRVKVGRWVYEWVSPALVRVDCLGVTLVEVFEMVT